MTLHQFAAAALVLGTAAACRATPATPEPAPSALPASYPLIPALPRRGGGGTGFLLSGDWRGSGGIPPRLLLMLLMCLLRLAPALHLLFLQLQRQRIVRVCIRAALPAACPAERMGDDQFSGTVTSICDHRQ